MWTWLERHSAALQGLGAIVTAMAALGAIIVIPLQIRAADTIQRGQTAREIYREFLNLTVQKPEVAAADYCGLSSPAEEAAYEAYVEFLLYTAEQVIDSDPIWEPTMANWMADHAAYLCTIADWSLFTPAVAALGMAENADCPTEPACAGAA